MVEAQAPQTQDKRSQPEREADNKLIEDALEQARKAAIESFERLEQNNHLCVERSEIEELVSTGVAEDPDAVEINHYFVKNHPDGKGTINKE